jgi:hypothetical protein
MGPKMLIDISGNPAIAATPGAPPTPPPPPNPPPPDPPEDGLVADREVSENIAGGE